MAVNFAQHINTEWDKPTEVKVGMLNDFCSWHGYQELIEDPDNPGEMIPNPVSKSRFFNMKVAWFIRESVHAGRWRDARAANEIEEMDEIETE